MHFDPRSAWGQNEVHRFSPFASADLPLAKVASSVQMTGPVISLIRTENSHENRSASIRRLRGNTSSPLADRRGRPWSMFLLGRLDAPK
jgi:hypothetical protein